MLDVRVNLYEQMRTATMLGKLDINDIFEKLKEADVLAKSILVTKD